MEPIIQKEAHEVSGKLARDRRYRNKHMEVGLCTKCPNPRSPRSRWLCDFHLDEANERRRKPRCNAIDVPAVGRDFPGRGFCVRLYGHSGPHRFAGVVTK